ncbi:MAG TPA: O-antigen ligase family protein, partial [Pseudobdellovibrionaceae bacterium]|nr:O-antigen ligase family protein [Pseudobdellovibrionaceae bacterium]
MKYFGYGMILSCLYGLYIFFTEHEGIYESDLRLASTWDVSRWGLVLMMSFIVILANRIDEREIRLSHRYFDLLLMILLPICLVLNNSRAPWLFGLIALFLYIVFLQRRYTLPFLIACSVLLASGLQLSPSFRARVATILSVQGSDQSTNNLKSTDPSNQARLTMWRIAWRVFHHAPWFGTGLEESESITRATIEQLKHEQPGFVIPRELSYRDQHSSYLTLLVQTGVFFTLVFIGLIALNILKGFRLSRLATSSQRDWGILASLLMFLMCAAVYSELVSLGSYFFWYFLGL